MSRLIMWNLMTLDGFFEGAKSWDLGWHDSVWGPELEALSLEQLRAAEAILFGRVTYQGMAAYWTTAKDEGEVTGLMNSVRKVVFSRTLERAEWNNTRLVSRNAADEVAAMKERGKGDLLVFGSGELSASLAERGLFDEYRLAVAPVVLGAGKQLFGRGHSQRLALLETRPLKSGGVILRYRPA